MAGIEARHSRTLGLSRLHRQVCVKRASKVRGDAFAFPITVPGGLGSLWSLHLFRRSFGMRDRRSLPARFGFGQRTLGGRR